MADKPDVQQEELDVFQDALDIKGSMSHRMEHPEEYLEAASEETPEAKAEREAAEAAAAALETETPEQKAEREAAEEAARLAASETPEQKAAREAEEDFEAKTKDWTVEDWKKGYRSAETRMHTATGETAKEKAARGAAEAKAAELEAKLAEKEPAAAKPPEISIEERKKEYVTQATAIRVKAAKEIAELDRTDEQYYDKWAAINSRTDLEIDEVKGKLFPVAATSEDLDTRIQATLKAERDKDEAKREETRKADEEAANARTWQEAQDLATKAGLDLKNRTIMASFRDYTYELPDDLKPKPLQEKVDWLVGKVRADLGIVVTQTDEERKLALENQRRNQPLGKGGNAPLKEEFKPKSFSERLENISP